MAPPVTRYSIQRKGWFSKVFFVMEGSGQIRAEMELRSNWRSFNMEPVLLRESTDPLPPLILLFAAHMIAIHQERSHGAVAG